MEYLFFKYLTRLCNFLGPPASSICSWSFGLWPHSLIYFLRKGFLTPSLENKRLQEQISRGLRSQKVAQSSFRLFFFFLFFHSSAVSAAYLSWVSDPVHTMVIQWETPYQDPAPSLVQYRAEGEVEWLAATGKTTPIHDSHLEIHTVELQKLDPDTLYQFRIVGQNKLQKFRTLPENLYAHPVRFAVAGDAYYFFRRFSRMNRQIAKSNPDFVVVGGDIAYTEGFHTWFGGMRSKVRRWLTFCHAWEQEMVAPDGRLIPLLVLPGNHDVKRKKGEEVDARFFYELFAMPKKGISYRSIDAGEYLSLFLLDTDHISRVEGAQTEWLKEDLAASKATYKFAAYHTAAYPSVYLDSSKLPKKIRALWSPLFEQYGVLAAFEHHNHAFKRTYPIKEGKINAEGVVYLGDGAWGVRPRKVVNERVWYLARSAQVNHFWHVTLNEKSAAAIAYNVRGAVIDAISFSPKASQKALSPVPQAEESLQP